MEQMFSSFPMFENRFGSEVLSPFADVVEEADKVIVTTDLPGIDRENIELSLRDNSLIINAGSRLIYTIFGLFRYFYEELISNLMVTIL